MRLSIKADIRVYKDVDTGKRTVAKLQASVTFPSKLRTLRSQLIHHTFSPAIIHRDSVSRVSLSLMERSNIRHRELEVYPACCVQYN